MEADGIIYVWYHPNKAAPKCIVSVSTAEKRTVRILPRGNWMDETGEVMKAALPSGLKLESEAFVVLPKDRVADDEADETEDEEGVTNNPAHPPVIGSASLGAEQQIFCALADHKPQSIEQLQINDVEFQFSQNFVHLEIIFQMIKMKKFNFINLKK